jgi:Putative motility protein
MMDIAALSISMNQAALGQSISIALVKKTMEAAQQNNQDLLKMLEAPHTHLGKSIDVKG